MDGFFVAKIMKLSDKRPEDDDDKDDDKVEETEVVDNEEEESEIDETDWAAEVKKSVFKSKKAIAKKGFESDVEMAKKRVAEAEAKAEEENAAEKLKVKSHVSVPPKSQKKQKKTTNAKVTKPRRRKQMGDM